MVDTVKLVLSKDMYWITDRNKFQKGIVNSGRGYATLVQNPTKSELEAGDYKPRLTITNRFNTTGRSEETLSVELSLPKLIYGNNFDELGNDDFEPIVRELQTLLIGMGVRIFSNILRNAPVSTIHYSKNIPLVDGSTPHFWIGKIKESNISLALDVNETEYRNDGIGYKWHSNSYEVAFYDKLKDLQIAKRTEKRAIENDNVIQLNLFDGLTRTKPFEVMRMEVRLNNRQKMRKLFKDLKIEKDLTFSDLFDSWISQKILTYYLDEMENKRLKLSDAKAQSPKDLLASIIINNPKIGVLKTFQMYGVIKAFKEITPRELRAMFGNYSPRSWSRLLAEVANIQTDEIPSPFLLIRKQLDDFVPTKLVDFSGVLINNDKYR